MRIYSKQAKRKKTKPKGKREKSKTFLVAKTISAANLESEKGREQQKRTIFEIQVVVPGSMAAREYACACECACMYVCVCA